MSLCNGKGRQSRALVWAAVVLVATQLLVGCEGLNLVKNVAVTGVTLDKSTATVASGSAVALSATVLPANATNKEVTWASNKDSVAIVTNAGLVTGVSPGSATITATTKDGGKIAKCDVTVTGTGTGTGGGTGATVSGTITLPADATGKTWFVGISSKLDSVASVTEMTGTVTGSTIAYSFSNVPAGTFYIYGGVSLAGLWVNGDRTIIKGDYVGVAGATLWSNVPTTPNKVIPSSGTLVVDFTAFNYPGSNNSDLSDLSLAEATLAPKFSSQTTEYTATVANTVTSVTLSATKSFALATVTSGTGVHNLNVGTNTLPVLVTAEDGSTQTYTVTVTRAEPAASGTIGTITVN